MQVTPTNTYSGNNGRSVILSDGLYYIAGNSNNGSGMPTNVVAAGGAQVATPGQSLTTAPTLLSTVRITILPPASHICRAQVLNSTRENDIRATQR
jgi:hypothetical protein